MMHQILHHPELSNLDLSSLASAGSGAAHLPSELLGAFKRRVKNLPFFVEGLDLPYHQWITLICILIRVRAVRMRMIHRLSVYQQR